ncbi:hypothetical protein INR49_009288 [Caranx melampygus]|nr:hypothetical protein INR49_009288 [Caranx melampygus]
MEILHHERGGQAFVNLALFQDKSSFTEDQTDDAVNEVQNIVAEYDVFDEEQRSGCTEEPPTSPTVQQWRFSGFFQGQSSGSVSRLGSAALSPSTPGLYRHRSS